MHSRNNPERPPLSLEKYQIYDKESRSRLRTLISEKTQDKIADTRILIVGNGGVGSNISDRAAQSGFGRRVDSQGNPTRGKITIWDGDVLEPTDRVKVGGYNFQRLGDNKTEIAQDRLQGFDPNINIEVHPEFLTVDKIPQVVTPDTYDYIFCCGDNYSVKAALQLYAEQTGTPLVMATDLDRKVQLNFFDYSRRAKLYNGKVSRAFTEQIATLRTDLPTTRLTPEQRMLTMKFLFSIVEPKNIPSTMINAFLDSVKRPPAEQFFSQTPFAANTAGSVAVDTIIRHIEGKRVKKEGSVNISDASTPTLEKLEEALIYQPAARIKLALTRLVAGRMATRASGKK